MLKSKFADILRTFSREELKQFRDFLRSPFHNTNKNVIKLFDLARKYAPEFESVLLKKENLFKKIYPGKKYNDTVMRILLSDLLKLGEKYLVLKRSQQDPSGEALELLQELNDRKLDTLYRKNYRYAKELLSKSGDARSRFFSDFELEIVNVDYYLRKDQQQLICQNIVERAENLIYFTLIEIVRNVHDMIMNERTYNAKYDFNLAYEFLNNFNFGAVVEKLMLNRQEHYPLIVIYYNLLKAMLEDKNELLYDTYKKSIETHTAKLNFSEVYHFVHHLESCCLNRMKYNPEKYRKELFRVYELMLQTQSYSSYGTSEMTIQRFKNIVVSAVNLNKLDWVQKFAEEYTDKLQPDYRESMRNYCDALVSFNKGEFQKSLELLNNVKSNYFILKLDVKSCLLKIYYELGYNDSVYSLIDSYKHFLTNNKAVSEHFKERNRNFLRFTSELLKYRNNVTKIPLGEIEYNLKNTENVVHKDWLFQKICEMESLMKKV